LGVSTNRDEWVLDLSKNNLTKKIKYFIHNYKKQLKSRKFDNNSLDYTIKWSETLKRTLKRKTNLIYNRKYLINYLYRPFCKVIYYSDKKLSDRLTANHYRTFGSDLCNDNFLITINTNGKEFWVLSSKIIVDLHFTGDAKCLPFYHYDKDGNRTENNNH
jgi:predicted helicase